MTRGAWLSLLLCLSACQLVAPNSSADCISATEAVRAAGKKACIYGTVKKMTKSMVAGIPTDPLVISFEDSFLILMVYDSAVTNDLTGKCIQVRGTIGNSTDADGLAFMRVESPANLKLCGQGNEPPVLPRRLDGHLPAACFLDLDRQENSWG